MTARQRSPDEPFKIYRIKLIVEQAREKKIMRGRTLWPSQKFGTYRRKVHGALT